MLLRDWSAASQLRSVSLRNESDFQREEPPHGGLNAGASPLKTSRLAERVAFLRFRDSPHSADEAMSGEGLPVAPGLGESSARSSTNPSTWPPSERLFRRKEGATRQTYTPSTVANPCEYCLPPFTVQGKDRFLKMPEPAPPLA
jgi:hypothetical protein